MSLGIVKLAIVTDDDVDITDPQAVERALAFRVQPDQDVIIVSGARGKHLDPSVMASHLPRGAPPKDDIRNRRRILRFPKTTELVDDIRKTGAGSGKS